MYKIAVCDDEKDQCSWFEDIIHRSGNGLWQICSIDKYYTGESLCCALAAGTEYDLVFLDIEFSSINGIEVGKYIRDELKDHSLQIVYISGRMEYAMSLFQNHPFDFLVKPLDEETVVGLIKRVISISEGFNELVQFVSKGKQKQILRSKDIIYASSNIRKVAIHTRDNEYEMYGKLSDLIRKLPENDFVSIHKSYLVNWLYISHISGSDVILFDGTELPVSRNRKKEFMDAWMKRMGMKYD